MKRRAALQCSVGVGLATVAVGIAAGAGPVRADEEGPRTVAALPAAGQPETGLRDSDRGPRESDSGNSGAPAHAKRAEPEPEPRHWIGADVLWWMFGQSKVPALVTSGNLKNGAILGASGTKVLLDSLEPIHDTMAGLRLNGGAWLDRRESLGLDGSLFFAGAPTDRFTAHGSGAPGSPVIGRPFVNALTGANDALIVAAPGIAKGSVTVSTSSHIQGGSLDLALNPRARTLSYHDRRYKIEWLVGPSFFHLDETLGIKEQSTALAGAAAPGTRTRSMDRFATDNHFYGGQVGLRGRYRSGRFDIDLMGRVAVGIDQQDVAINGGTVITPAGGPPARSLGGLLALASNIGSFSQSTTAGVSELALNVHYRLRRNVRVVAGYQFLLAGNMLRPGEQIDTTVNPNHVPGLAGGAGGDDRPAFAFNPSNFGASGFNLGLEWRY